MNLAELLADGFSVTENRDGNLVLKPSSKVTPEIREKVGKAKDLIKSELKNKASATPKKNGWGPGSQLLKIMPRSAKFWAALKLTCRCDVKAAEMDTDGPEGCERKRTEYINHLMSQAPAVYLAKPWFRAKAEELFDNAIELAKSAQPRKDAGPYLCEYCGRNRKRAGEKKCLWCSEEGIAQKKPVTNRGTSFRETGERRWVSVAQLHQDTLALVSKIPPDTTAIAGVARSGMSVATMVSMMLHLPLFAIRQTKGDIIEAGNGWRLGGSRHIDPRAQRVAVVDDTVMTGNSLKAVSQLANDSFENALFAAVYVNPLAKRKPDIWAVDLPWPHLLEWNIFNSVLSPNMALDFDGILCRDCSRQQDDDGARYLDFIRNASPLYLPRKTHVPLIVTARIEKYREPTMEWLERHGVTVDRLVMHPANTLADRNRDDIPAYKAHHFNAWASKHRPKPPPLMFVESDDNQAKRIAELSGRMVVCPASGKVY